MKIARLRMKGWMEEGIRLLSEAEEEVGREGIRWGATAINLNLTSTVGKGWMVVVVTFQLLHGAGRV